MASRLVKDLEPVTRELVKRLMAQMKALGHPVRPTCTYRSIEEQNELYAQGRTKPGKIVTKAKGGESPHNYGMAADFIFVKEGYEGPWHLMGRAATDLGLVWGGTWKVLVDRPHVERPNWRNLIG